MGSENCGGKENSMRYAFPVHSWKRPRERMGFVITNSISCIILTGADTVVQKEVFTKKVIESKNVSVETGPFLQALMQTELSLFRERFCWIRQPENSPRTIFKGRAHRGGAISPQF